MANATAPAAMELKRLLIGAPKEATMDSCRWDRAQFAFRSQSWDYAGFRPVSQYDYEHSSEPVCSNKVWPDIGAAFAASWANELGLKIRQPNPIGPPVAADRNVMTARIVRAID
jgi:hypothetical protein